MLFSSATLASIAAGDVTLAFRRWRVARVHPGSTVRTGIGVIGITDVVAIDLQDITADEAHQAGFPTLRALIDELERSRDGQLYRIGLRFAGDDPRIALRMHDELSEDERDELLHKVRALGARSSGGAWAGPALRLIESHPATRAAKLAGMMGMETHRFKTRVRQLKELGLTESLEIGYRLSPRGRAVLHWLNAALPTTRDPAAD
jgi:hypothetical protein